MIGHWTMVIFGGPATGKSSIANILLDAKNPLGRLLHADKKDSSKKLKL